MKQIKRGMAVILAALMMALIIPATVMAAEAELSTEFISVKEADGQIEAVYECGKSGAPERILYAVTKNGQYIWDGILEAESGGGKQKCILDVPTHSIKRSVYDVVVWAESDTDSGEKATSPVYAFRLTMGDSQGDIQAPRIQQPKQMIVRAPFAYIAGSADMNNPVCYLKSGDIVQVYTDPEDSAVLYVVKGNVGGYMYSRTLVSKVFGYQGAGDDQIVKIALTQLGNVGGAPFWSWYGFGSRVEWCACYVSWCANQCGYIESGCIPKFAACVDGMNWFIERGQWEDRSIEPQPGYIIFFDWDNSGDADHVGIVEYCENGVVHTVEGNTSDSCARRTYSVGSSNIRGYGVPDYK